MPFRDGLAKRGHSVSEDEGQCLERERFPQRRSPLRIQEWIELRIALVRALESFTIEEEIPVWINVVFVNPSDPREAGRVEGVKEHALHGRGPVGGPPLEQRELYCRSEEPLDAVNARRDDEHALGIAAREGTVDGQLLAARSGGVDRVSVQLPAKARRGRAKPIARFVIAGRKGCQARRMLSGGGSPISLPRARPPPR